MTFRLEAVAPRFGTRDETGSALTPPGRVEPGAERVVEHKVQRAQRLVPLGDGVGGPDGRSAGQSRVTSAWISATRTSVERSRSMVMVPVSPPPAQVITQCDVAVTG